MSNLHLALKARDAVYRGDYTTAKGWCQGFIHELIDACYSSTYAAYCADSAAHSAEAWQGSEFVVTDGDIQIGDLLYKTKGSGNFGHVGIYVGDDLVAENSSTKIGRIRGALGFRTLAEFDSGIAHDVTVRIPDPHAWRVFVGTENPNPIAATEHDADGHVWVMVRHWAARLGFKAAMVGGRVTLGGRGVAGDVWLAGDTAVMKLTDLAKSAGLRIIPGVGQLRCIRPQEVGR